MSTPEVLQFCGNFLGPATPGLINGPSPTFALGWEQGDSASEFNELTELRKDRGLEGNVRSRDPGQRSSSVGGGFVTIRMAPNSTVGNSAGLQHRPSPPFLPPSLPPASSLLTSQCFQHSYWRIPCKEPTHWPVFERWEEVH